MAVRTTLYLPLQSAPPQDPPPSAHTPLADSVETYLRSKLASPSSHTLWLVAHAYHFQEGTKTQVSEKMAYHTAEAGCFPDMPWSASRLVPTLARPPSCKFIVAYYKGGIYWWMRRFVAETALPQIIYCSKCQGCAREWPLCHCSDLLTILTGSTAHL
jgi:hypothetical protein